VLGRGDVEAATRYAGSGDWKIVGIWRLGLGNQLKACDVGGSRAFVSLRLWRPWLTHRWFLKYM